MKVAVLGAGGPAGVNWCRALHKAGHHVLALDGNTAHLRWCKPFGNTGPLPRLTDLDRLAADLLWPQPDTLVRSVAEAVQTGRVRTPTFLPSLEVIDRCQDKQATADLWYRAGLRSLPPVPLDGPLPDLLHQAKDAFGLPFWLRATAGAGARGATLVEDLRTAHHWVRYWETRGSDIDWVCEEYLPGRDIAWTGIYRDGHLLISFARQRLEYLYPHLTPDGLTGTPTIAQVIRDPMVNSAAEAAVAAVDEKPNGVYAVDLREDINGVPRPTEINPGRGGTTVGLWSTYTINFAAIAVEAALTGYVTLGATRRDPLPEGLRLSRHIDCAGAFSLEPIEQRKAA